MLLDDEETGVVGGKEERARSIGSVRQRRRKSGRSRLSTEGGYHTAQFERVCVCVCAGTHRNWYISAPYPMPGPANSRKNAVLAAPDSSNKRIVRRTKQPVDSGCCVDMASHEFRRCCPPSAEAACSSSVRASAARAASRAAAIAVAPSGALGSVDLRSGELGSAMPALLAFIWAALPAGAGPTRGIVRGAGEADT